MKDALKIVVQFIDVWRQKETAVKATQLTNLLLSNASHEGAHLPFMGDLHSSFLPQCARLSTTLSSRHPLFNLLM